LYRPDYYAKELLGTIFSLLNGCSSMPNDEGICAILIDALAFLCESEVVDMISTWDAMSNQLSKEKRYYFSLLRYLLNLIDGIEVQVFFFKSKS